MISMNKEYFYENKFKQYRIFNNYDIKDIEQKKATIL